MYNQEWDPLKSEEHIDSEIIFASKKREIKNILKSYVGFFDPFSELIQNALDAVDKRSRFEVDTNFKKKVWITIDLSKNQFSVTDNGIGFQQKQFQSFLAPNISYKDGEKHSRGNKGVGATYIAYGFNHLQLATKTPEFQFSGELLDGRQWVDDKDGVISRPVVKSANPQHKVFEDIDRGSTFTLKFGGENTRPKDLTWIAATTAEQWLYLLLVKTPLGCIDLFAKNKNPTNFELNVIDHQGNESKTINSPSEYMYPHKKINASIDLKEILMTQQRLISAGKDASALPAKYTKLNGIYEYFNAEEVKLLNKNFDDFEISLISKYNIEAYGYFSYSTIIWDEFNDNLAKLRKGYRVLRGGLQMANNFMPQGDLISIPLTSNIGYQNQTHVIVHLTDADPDLGRKGFQPELKDLSERIAVGIVNRLKRWKNNLKGDTGINPELGKEIALKDWIKHQEKHEESNPLKITNPHFFAPVNEISICSTPQSEQDAIVLFNQLIAGGVIRGMKLLASSQNAQYDGVFRFNVNPPESNHIFDKLKNPLGVSNLQLSLGTHSPLYVLEYKYNLDGFIREIENGEKREKDVHLVVVWEIGSEWKKHYDVTSLLISTNIHLRDFHGLTHVLQSSTSKIYLIVLKELIGYLNDPDIVQLSQQLLYEENFFD